MLAMRADHGMIAVMISDGLFHGGSEKRGITDDDQSAYK